MADESPEGKKQGFLNRIGSKVADTAQRADQKMTDFLHDPSKPVKTGKDAPEISNTRDWTSRPQTPQEQQQMSIPEAVYKKGVKPALGAAKDWLKPKSEEKAAPQVVPAQAQKPLSFSERLAQQREAERADPARAQQKREADLARLKQGREQEKERGR